MFLKFTTKAAIFNRCGDDRGDGGNLGRADTQLGSDRD